MIEVQEKFIKLLKEMFQFDQADLDFGIYRIMNAKHDEIEKFLNEYLPKEIDEGLVSLESFATSEQIKKIKDQIATAKSMDLDQAMKDSMIAKLEEQKAKLDAVTDMESAQNEIYNNLLDFFSRYYDEGDFISQRRYSKGKYAIPYEGEEVKLHWANADQYYIKTSEYFKDYTFSDAFGNKVHFKILDAETEQNNNKSKDKKFFQLTSQETKFEVIDDEFYIYVEYKAGTQKTQKPYNAEIIDAFTKFVNTDLTKYQSFAGIAAKEKGQDSSLLEKQLIQYTAKNSFDYFIHKNLRGFLNQELDFFIKNELIRLDDIDETDEAKTKLILTKAKVLRTIAKKIISFLAQLEDFQKKLFLKKKFVTETNYCITLDRIDESFYEEIAANEEQRKEWVKLFAIDELKATSGDLLTQGKTAYSEPLTVQFLKENPFLVLDTVFFTEEFKEKLVASIDDFDEKLDGQLIHSENFQALSLLQKKYGGAVDCCYIDPPYNATFSEIIYKNNYKHSSWLSLMSDRLLATKDLLRDNGLITIAIDDYEMPKLWELMNNLYGYENHLGTISVRINPKGRMTERKISAVHEYTLVFGKTEKSYVKKLPENPEDKTHNYKKDENGQWYLPNNLRKQGVDSEAVKSDGTMRERYFPIYYDPNTGRVSSKIKLEVEILPIDEAGNRRIWRRGFEAIDELYEKGDIWVNKIKNQYQVYYKFYGGLDGKMVQSIWTEAECSASDYGTKILDNILGKRELFSYPKAPFAVQKNIQAMIANQYTKAEKSHTDSELLRNSQSAKNIENDKIKTETQNVYHIKNRDAAIYVASPKVKYGTTTEKEVRNVSSEQIRVTTSNSPIILDFFAGSGTTAHAVINLNREDNGNRKYILCEMGEYFDTVTKPRVQKVIYSKDWKDGKPVSREGSSHAFKYIRLESYEDTLNNITLKPKETDLLDSVRKDYVLNYMMDFESKDSDSLLNIEKLAHPFNYVMKITRKQECKEQKIDLVETFNYLIGLNVTSNGALQSYDATFTNDASKPIVATLKNNGSTYRIKMIEGTNRTGERVLVIWRDLTGDIEKDNAVLDTFFAKKHVNPLDFEYKTIYVNGDNNLQNVKTEDETWKVVLIESEMKKRMFSGM